MTSTPDLNITGSPIYENLVAASGDPYQPPAYQLPDVYGAGNQGGGAAMAGYTGGDPGAGWDFGAGPGVGMGAGMPYAMGTPAMLSQFLGGMLGDGQSWVAVLIFGGPMADQLRMQQQYQQYGMPPQQPVSPYPAPAQPGSGSLPGYGDTSGGFDPAGYNAMAQAYQQAYLWAAQQQAALGAAQQPPPLALTAGPDTAGMPQYSAPPALPAAEETQTYGGMLSQDWASWLGESSQNARPQEEDPEDPYERRGGRLTGRFGAAMRELRGR